MSAIKQPKLAAPEREARLRNMSINHIGSMRDAGDFVLAVGKLLEASALDDMPEGVMTPLVVNGLGKGLQMLGVELWTTADRNEARLEGELAGGPQ